MQYNIHNADQIIYMAITIVATCYILVLLLCAYIYHCHTQVRQNWGFVQVIWQIPHLCMGRFYVAFSLHYVVYRDSKNNETSWTNAHHCGQIMLKIATNPHPLPNLG